MRTQRLNWFWLGLAMTATIMSCKKDDISDPEIPNEQELITTIELRLTPNGGGQTILLSYEDLDGDGLEPPVQSKSDSLDAGVQYNAELLLLNNTVSPADTINGEIVLEAEEHQFFYAVDGVDLQVSYADTDGNGNPIGLSTSIQAGIESGGSLTITLRHAPDKFATGVAQGDIMNAGGETDIEASLNVVIH